MNLTMTWNKQKISNNKVSNKGILTVMGGSFLSPGPQSSLLVIKKRRLFLILATLLTPQNWSLVKYDSPIAPDFAELGVTEAIFNPY